MFEIKLSYDWKLNYDQSLTVISTKKNINRLSLSILIPLKVEFNVDYNANPN